MGARACATADAAGSRPIPTPVVRRLAERERAAAAQLAACRLHVGAQPRPYRRPISCGDASITTALDPYGRLYSGDMGRYADQLDSAADEASKSK